MKATELLRLGFLNSGGGAQAFDSPWPLLGGSIAQGSNKLWWMDVDADSYTLQQAESSDYSDASDIYTGSNLNYTKTGLSNFTDYYYRVKSTSGGVDSEWVNCTVKTLPLISGFWFELTGMVYGVDNSYADTTNGQVDNLLSALGVSGPTAAYSAVAKAAINLLDDVSITTSLKLVGSTSMNLSAPFSAPGPFTLMFSAMATTGWGPFKHFVNHLSTGTSYVVFASTTVINISASGSSKSFTVPAMVATKYYDIVITRDDSDNTKVSLDGGATWTATQVITGTFVFDTLFGSNAGGNRMHANLRGRLVCTSTALSDSEISSIYNFLNCSAIIPETETSPAPKGLTWLDFASGYTAETLDIAPLGSSNYDRVISDGNYSYILGRKPTAGTFSSQMLYVFYHVNNKYAYIDLGYYTASTNVHNQGALRKKGNILHHLQPTSHYGTPSVYTTLKVKSSGKNYNLSAITQRPVGKDIAGSVANFIQYEQFAQCGNVDFLIAQSYDGSTGRYIDAFPTVDGYNFYDKYRILDAGSGKWFYHFVVQNGTGLPIYLFWFYITGSPTRYQQVGVLKSTNGYTWTNLAGSFSNDVRFNNAITLAEAQSNSLLLDGTALLGEARVTYALQETNGDVYGIMSNGSDTAWSLFTIKSDVFASQTLDFDTHASLIQFGGLWDICAIKTDTNSYDIYAMENTLSDGKYRTAKFSTTDGGATALALEGYVSTDNTKNHNSFFPSKNYHFCNKKVLTISGSDGTNSKLQFVDITP